MNSPETTALDIRAARRELDTMARKAGADVTGVADPAAFTEAPEGYRPQDLLPGAKAVYVMGGAAPRAGDWRNPKYQFLETSSFSDRIFSTGVRVARAIEETFGYYALCVPAGVDRGDQPFLSIALAAELAGCGSRSLAGPVLHPELGFLYYAAVITTLPLAADGPLAEPACPAPACLDMWQEHGATPCMAVCDIDDGGCIGGRIEHGRVVERRYDRARCRTRVETWWIPGFQKVLEATLNESDRERRRYMLYSSMFTRTLWSMTYSNVSQGQCFECMRVCPVGEKARTRK
jgi:hypothetical protein